MLIESLIGLGALILLAFLGIKLSANKVVTVWIFMIFLFYNSLYQIGASLLYGTMYLIPHGDSSIFEIFMGNFQVLLFVFYAFIQLGGEVVRFISVKRTHGKIGYFPFLLIAAISWLPPFFMNELNFQIVQFFIYSPKFSKIDVIVLFGIFTVWSVAMTYFSMEALSNTKFVLLAAICFYLLELILVAFAGNSQLQIDWPAPVFSLTVVLLLLILTHITSKFVSKKGSQISTQS